MFYAHGYDKGSQITRLEAWTRIKERSGKVKQELKDKPSLRPEAAYLWRMYCDIKRGCEFVRLVDIDAYTRLKKVSLVAWEVDILLDIEQERCRQHG